MHAEICEDTVILNQWHPISSTDDLKNHKQITTMLLGEKITCKKNSNGNYFVWKSIDIKKKLLPIKIAYGYLWTSLGTPPTDLFSFPEFYEIDRRNVATGVFGVNISAGRTIENFLDMGHFPFVHTGVLGEEPHTEVKEYDVSICETNDEILATKCQFYQPQAAVISSKGAEVDYIYRIPHINCAILYKSSPVDKKRQDAIIIFVQLSLENGHEMGPRGSKWHKNTIILHISSRSISWRPSQNSDVQFWGTKKPLRERPLLGQNL